MDHVLLVDDDPTQLRVRELVLRNAGFRVSIATTVESALALLQVAAQKIDVVITDHLLPGRSGAELVRDLRRIAPEMPVLVLTGLSDIDSEYKGLGVSIRQKPLPPAELISFIRSAFNHQRD